MRQAGPADSQTLSDIFTAQRRSLVGMAERITGCRHHAEDVVQDAFLKLLGADSTSAIRAKAGYLMMVVRNLAIDHYRRKGLESRLLAAEEEGQAVSTPEAASPESVNVNRQLLQTLESALADLPERTRYAFEMHRIHGHSQKDIAATLGVSPTLVNYMIRDALVHCRKAMRRIDPSS
ncbi:RNA polymerase factor sigma-70 [Azospirillum thermophilum]|uniref:RNA polymerase factor sigma-70 n=1 Tax=Azospirillum thermophilum TaxID=2202148 RepID=A0A2S2CVG6_9PROT|nr:RNA polymerase factor sigma-70 [Azospirillum thermophilum]AWK88514.1 RNA polymerase factor sigma-70 [Azospirillum thermophilum]